MHQQDTVNLNATEAKRLETMLTPLLEASISAREITLGAIGVGIGLSTFYLHILPIASLPT